MADVFISYARADRARINSLAARLEAAGFSVWWDRDIETGEAFSRIIERELAAAGAIVVAWSERSAGSDWVKDEASYARTHNKLVPIRLDKSPPPLDFQQYQAVDFSLWRGDDKAAAFHTLVRAIKTKTANDDEAPQGTSTPRAYPFNLFGKHRRLAIAAGLFAVAVIAALALLTLNREGPPPEPSVAVLPFETLSNNQDDAFFADGLSEEIIDDLAKINALQVAPRTSSLYYGKKANDIRETAASLGVAHVLEGSVRRSGERLRVTVQLINADSGFHLWSETYDRTMDGIFAIQEDIAEQVAAALRAEILGKEQTLLAARISDTAEIENIFLTG